LCWFLGAVLAEARVLDPKGNPLPQVLSIFRLLTPLFKPLPGFPKARLDTLLSPQTLPAQVLLKDLLFLAQTFFKRPDGTERWNPEFQQKFQPYHTKEMQHLFLELGVFEKVQPLSPLPVDYLIVFGSLVERIQERISYLSSLYQKRKLNLSPQVQVILLASDRPLTPFEVSQLRSIKPHTSSLPKTEAQAIQWLWTNMRLPNGLHELPIHVVESRRTLMRKKGTDGIPTPLRPSALDTLKKWLASKPFPGHCLSFSNQPFVYYHQLLTAFFFQRKPLSFRQGWSFETIGTPPKSNVSLSILLDNLARILELEAKILGQT
jgi:hypothetical protein